MVMLYVYSVTYVMHNDYALQHANVWCCGCPCHIMIDLSMMQHGGDIYCVAHVNDEFSVCGGDVWHRVYVSA